MTRLILNIDRFKAPRSGPRKIITRRWVETADERCPLAGVWFALGEILDTQDDEPGLPEPAFYRFLWKAGSLLNVHLPLTCLTPLFE